MLRTAYDSYAPRGTVSRILCWCERLRWCDGACKKPLRFLPRVLLLSKFRCFVPARMESATITGRKFKRPDSFSLDQHLEGAFGSFSSDESYDIRIRFTKAAAPFIREKTWHPTQKLKELKNGCVEISLKLSHLIDIRRWILGWGGQAKVLAPAELLESVQAEAKIILRQ